MAIALLTDFGFKDAYVGILKGVLHTIAPQTPVLDISHDVPAFDIVQAGLILEQAYRYFPKQTIFVAVVDPGVGGHRKPILVETEDYYFIGPDNGILSLVLCREKINHIFNLNKEEFFIHPVSPTFHARDIFCPVAAHLSKGVPSEKLGEPFSGYIRAPDFFPVKKNGRILGKILAIDRFGNATTNLRASFLRHHCPERHFELVLKRGKGKPLRLKDLRRTYAEAPKNKPILLFGSSGFLEIALREANAAERLKIKSGDIVEIESRKRR